MPPTLRAASIVLASVVVATLVTFPISRGVVPNPDVLFIAAVIVSARYAGAAAGLCSAILSFFVFDWFFDPTPHILDVTFTGLVRATVFISVSLLVASLENQRRQAMSSLEETNNQLRSTLHEIKVLHGILPICSYCKRIRTESEAWVQMEKYIREHKAQFTHSVCPDCLRKYYPDIYHRKYGSM
jgi:K+-sensing histidine kinase KdpD